MNYGALTVSSVLVGIIAVATCCPACAEDSYPLRDLVECSPRGGLPNFFAKLKSDGEVRIAYLGGSITSQRGWRVLSRRWFQAQYPSARVSQIDAAVGGTASDLGVFRLRHDVLRFAPDLLFVEFAVNDSSRGPMEIVKSMEGIVRQTWTALPRCDICYVYAFTARHIDDMQRGKMHQAASVMEEIADHYQIPSIHMGVEAIALLRDGALEMRAEGTRMSRVSGDEADMASAVPVNENGRIPFSADGVHPYTNTGHRLYLNAIVRSMPMIQACGRTGTHPVGPPIAPDNWERAAMIPLDRAELLGPWERLDPAADPIAKRFSHRLPGLWKGAPGATLRFSFTGTKVSLYDLLGPGCGFIRVNVDGTSREHRRMDAYCTYYRLAVRGCADNLANEEHSVEVTVLETQFDKSAVLFERNRHDLRKRPEKYGATDWYAGAIFVIGELIAR